MDTVHDSITEVAELISNPLQKAIYGLDFRRGPGDVDGLSLFIAEDLHRPVKFDIFGEVKNVGLNEHGPLLTLGRPAGSSARTNLYWRQQISALERVELEDMDIDQGLRRNPHIQRWIVNEGGGEDRILMNAFMDTTAVDIVDQWLQTVQIVPESDDAREEAIVVGPGNLVRCRVVLGTHQNLRGSIYFRHYLIFALSIDKVQGRVCNEDSVNQWRLIGYE
ncbi:hypothetical protein M378DRAFT_181767 [Amanita muscaria Koide BX008]|uniref:Uncharacterized protein n=1 Tax=Amanita muscaria (strain Koide BX008) TaxID=946122 RepID=A0A0C2SSS7_AMAMK|nr:hypothetical protein M378DRAFT_181767 [Amanita muscaria Koide BX008]